MTCRPFRAAGAWVQKPFDDRHAIANDRRLVPRRPPADDDRGTVPTISRFLCPLVRPAARIPDRALEIKIDEGSRASLAYGDCDDPAEQQGGPNQFGPASPYRQPDEAVVVEPVKCREYRDQQNWKDVLGEERPDSAPASRNRRRHHVDRPTRGTSAEKAQADQEGEHGQKPCGGLR